MTLQPRRGTRSPAHLIPTNKTSRNPTHPTQKADAHVSDQPEWSGRPDYLAYQVRRGVPRAEWPFTGRGVATANGDRLVTFTKQPRSAVVLRPQWRHLVLGRLGWDRPPDYEVFAADDNGRVTGRSRIGEAWNQTGGSIYVKLHRHTSATVVLRRVRTRTVEQAPRYHR
jgi:hypothetical protein